MCPDPFTNSLLYKPVGTHGLRVAVVSDLVCILDKDSNHHAFSRDAAHELMEWLFSDAERKAHQDTPQEQRGFGQVESHPLPERPERY